MENPTPGASFRCDKCGHTECEIGEVRAAGSTLSRIFDVEREAFTAVTCGRCGYTELYKADRPAGGPLRLLHHLTARGAVPRGAARFGRREPFPGRSPPPVVPPGAASRRW